LKNHVRRAATAVGITKTIGWHTFRHSVGSHLGQSGENVKVVQELFVTPVRGSPKTHTSRLIKEPSALPSAASLEFCLSPQKKTALVRVTKIKKGHPRLGAPFDFLGCHWAFAALLF